MKKLIHVGNTGEGHLRLVFGLIEPGMRDGYSSDEDDMVIVHCEDGNEENIVELEVLFVEEPDRIENMMKVAKRLDLDISPLFTTYAGSLAA